MISALRIMSLPIRGIDRHSALHGRHCSFTPFYSQIGCPFLVYLMSLIGMRHRRLLMGTHQAPPSGVKDLTSI